MKPISLLQAGAAAWPTGALGRLHLQRLAERWLRRWGYALAGLALGWSGMWWARPEVNEAYASALREEARLAQQMASVPSGASGQTSAKEPATVGPSVTQAQRLWHALPVLTRPETLWADWHHALAAQGLRLQFLQPMASSGAVGGSGALVSHTAAWRVLGRFDDWARVWAACAVSGPVCAIERIHVVATDPAETVQIDAVMRVWMRPAEGRTDDGVHGGATPWMATERTGLAQSGRARDALFAPSRGASAAAVGANSGATDGVAPATRTEGTSAAVASLADLPDDPHQWPFSLVRLAGLWQQGDERQAVLSAGAHSVRVTPGQRVTLEGHRVVAINDQGVHVRLGKGPWLALAWAEVRPVGESSGPSSRQISGPSPSQLTGPSTPAHNTGRLIQ